jgi:tRNA U34 5-methylaminomethyl-2-thiouridine-forming methyltransferase MnmC
MNQIVKTSDGPHTIYVPELNEHYHSIHGAVQESQHIFIREGYDNCNAEPLNIFEAGFGTGLNALLTAVRAVKENREVYYTSIEKYPVGSDLIMSLNHYEFAGPDGKRIFELIQSSPWEQMNCICNNFNLRKINGDLSDYIPEYPIDLVYFDAFGPDKQPSMWTREIFERISSAMRSGGILVTYSSKGEVKRNLRSAGFYVKLLPGPPGKREMISEKKI